MQQSGDILPNSLIPDIPTRFPGFSPKNFDQSYSGAVTADSALSQSLNIPAVKMLQKYNPERFLASSEKNRIYNIQQISRLLWSFTYSWRRRNISVGTYRCLCFTFTCTEQIQHMKKNIIQKITILRVLNSKQNLLTQIHSKNRYLLFLPHQSGLPMKLFKE